MELGAAIVVFVLSHVGISRTRLKPILVAKLGQRAYLAVYSLLSIALLVWVVSALRRTPRVVLWPTEVWSYSFAFAVTAVAFALIGAGVASANPLSVSFRSSGFDPQRPGVAGWIRHPVLWGFGLWGFAHIPANGDIAALSLFGGVVVFSLLGGIMLDLKAKRTLGAEAWNAIRKRRGPIGKPALGGAAAGLALWAIMLLAHPFLIGPDPLAVILAPS